MIWNLCQYKSNIALIDDKGSRLSYDELYNQSKMLIKNLVPRSLVMILCRNTIGSVIGYVSCVNNELVPLLLNSELENDSLNHLLNLYRPRYLWVPVDKKEKFKGIVIFQSYNYCLIETDYTDWYPINPELALLLTTSGSTGSPKFVRQSYKNILSNTKSIVEYLELSQSERPITTLPMNYTYGLSIINTHLIVGATILITEHRIIEKEFWNFFKENNATSFGGVPYTYEILNRLKFDKMDLPSLRTITQAGGKLSIVLQQKFTKLAKTKGFKFIVMYGQCEATARMSYLPMNDAEAHYGSIGIPIPGGRFSIVDDYGKEINEPDIGGELIYYGDNVTLGYAEDGEDLIKGDERKGVLETGDIAKFDNNHFYYIIGRKKRFLKVFGNRVNLDELEQLIKQQYKEIEVAVSGYDDHIFVFIKDEKIPNYDLKNYLVHKTGLNSIAFKIRVIKEIPKNESGKIVYQKLPID